MASNCKEIYALRKTVRVSSAATIAKKKIAKENKISLYAMRKKGGICTYCGLVPSCGEYAKCQKCKDLYDRQRKNRENKRIALNLCVVCGKNPPKFIQGKNCEPCIVRNMGPLKNNTRPYTKDRMIQLAQSLGLQYLGSDFPEGLKKEPWRCNALGHRFDKKPADLKKGCPLC